MIRLARAEDAERIAQIYAHYVLNTAISFEAKAPDAAEIMRRMALYQLKYPYLVLEENARVAGYAYASAYRARAAYAPTVEISIYIDNELLGGGRGHALGQALIERLRADERYYTAVACVALPNARSEALFEALGFKYIGRLDDIGWKLGKWRSLACYALKLRDSDSPPPT